MPVTKAGQVARQTGQIQMGANDDLFKKSGKTTVFDLNKKMELNMKIPTPNRDIKDVSKYGKVFGPLSSNGDSNIFTSKSPTDLVKELNKT